MPEEVNGHPTGDEAKYVSDLMAKVRRGHKCTNEESARASAILKKKLTAIYADLGLPAPSGIDYTAGLHTQEATCCEAEAHTPLR